MTDAKRCPLPSIGTGRNFAILANAISDAIYNAAKSGMEIDEATCCAAAVIADYARVSYGPEYLASLAKIITDRGLEPLPDVKWEGPTQ